MISSKTHFSNLLQGTVFLKYATPGFEHQVKDVSWYLNNRGLFMSSCSYTSSNGFLFPSSLWVNMPTSLLIMNVIWDMGFCGVLPVISYNNKIVEAISSSIVASFCFHWVSLNQPWDGSVGVITTVYHCSTASVNMCSCFTEIVWLLLFEMGNIMKTLSDHLTITGVWMKAIGCVRLLGIKKELLNILAHFPNNSQ